MKTNRFKELEEVVPCMKLWRNLKTSEILEKQKTRTNKHVCSKILQTNALPVFHSYKPTSLIKV